MNYQKIEFVPDLPEPNGPSIGGNPPPVCFNGSYVKDIEVDGVDPDDYPDFCDAYFSHAVWFDTGEPLNEDELYKLQKEYPDLLYEMALEYWR